MREGFRRIFVLVSAAACAGTFLLAAFPLPARLIDRGPTPDVQQSAEAPSGGVVLEEVDFDPHLGRRVGRDIVLAPPGASPRDIDLAIAASNIGAAGHTWMYDAHYGRTALLAIARALAYTLIVASVMALIWKTLCWVADGFAKSRA